MSLVLKSFCKDRLEQFYLIICLNFLSSFIMSFSYIYFCTRFLTLFFHTKCLFRPFSYTYKQADFSLLLSKDKGRWWRFSVLGDIKCFRISYTDSYIVYLFEYHLLWIELLFGQFESWLSIFSCNRTDWTGNLIGER